MTGEQVHLLLLRARDELYQAKTLVRATRNHTKLQAAALADSELRIDGLLEEIEAVTHPQVPTPEEAQEHGTATHREVRV